jgi:nitrogen fixation NifU-like protein
MTQDEFDRFVADLQRQVDEQARAEFSEKLIEQASHPDHVGRMDEPDLYGKSVGWCGDMMEFYLRLDGGRIGAARFMTNGCGPTLACGNTLARLAEGLTLEEAGGLIPERIVDGLDGLPEGHLHCADLAVATLQNALFSWRLEREKEEG